MSLLTVRETLQFALQNSVVSKGKHLDDPDVAKAMQRRVDTMIELLSLQECEDTYLGNDLIRGVSGGQKKRVSVGEVLVTNARAILLDEFSTGLDTSTTFDITDALRAWTRVLNGMLVAAMLQPTPEVYNLFDDILLLREGAVVFHGPRDRLTPYLESIGFTIPSDMDMADYIIELLTDPAAVYAKQVRVAAGSDDTPAATDSAKATAAPTCTSDMVAAWKKSTLYAHLSAAIAGTAGKLVTASAAVSASAPDATTFDVNSPTEVPEMLAVAGDKEDAVAKASPIVQDSKAAPGTGNSGAPGDVAVAAAHGDLADSSWVDTYKTPTVALDSKYTTKQYGQDHSLSWSAHTRLNVERQWRLLIRNPIFLGSKILQSVFMGLILGSIFYDLDLTEANTRIGCLLFGIIHLSFANFVSIPWAIEFRSAVQKQLRLGFYPASSFVISVLIMNFPVAVVESVVLGAFIYFMPGFDPSAERFIVYLVLLILQDILFASVFQLLAYIAPNMEASQSLAGPLVGALVLAGGVLNTRDSISPAGIWLYWLSPFSWTTRSMALNEFLAPRYSDSVPGTSDTVGEALLKSFDFHTDSVWVGAGIAYLIAAYILFAFLTVYAIKHIRYDVSVGTKRTDEEDESTAIDIVPTSTALPFPQANLAFRNLGYTVKLKDGTERALLTNVNGFVRAGSCTALCGVSGAGKSTLLDVIAGRKTAGVQVGEVFVNGKTQDKRTFARITAYVEQQDLHTSYTTVQEAIEFAAVLRLPASVTPEQRAAVVEEIMTLLELKQLAGRLVGELGGTNALSPSQRKLLSIAVELVSQPSILFLDEPTSGLDSRAAANVMRVVRNIARTGRTVICTIHQPSKEVFLTSFDAMLLLQRGGFPAFFGDLGQDAEHLVAHLGQFPGVQPPASADNPATWMLDVLGGGTGTLSEAAAPVDPEAAAVEKRDFVKAYADSDLCKSNLEQVGKFCVPAGSAASGEVEAPTSEFARSFGTQFYYVLGRHWTSYWRNVDLNFTRLLVYTILGFVFGLFYLNVQTDTPGGVVSKLSLMFMACAFAGLIGQGIMLPVLAKERAVFYRERSSNMYGPEVYGLAHFICEAPWMALFNLCIVAVYYNMAGFESDAGKFFQYTFVHYVASMVFIAMGTCIAVALPDVQTAQMASSLLLTMNFLLGGVFSPLPVTPAGWQWFFRINPVYYALNSLASPQFFCDTPPSVNATSGAAAFNCPSFELATPQGVQRVPTWEFVRDTYELDHSDVWEDIGYCALLGGVWVILSLLSLRYINHLKR
jgi:ABC-type multidrug transport system ATPase subunit/ABC-type multidrug transport system permease subunit